MTDWITLIQTAGPVVAAIAFFIWRDYMREDKMTLRIQALEDFQKQQLVEMVSEQAKLQAETNLLLTTVGTTISKCQKAQAMEGRA